MSKEAVFTMKLEPELRTEFMAAAKASHRPASPVNGVSFELNFKGSNE